MFQLLSELLYPRVCPSCASPLEKAEKNICFRCFDELSFCPYLPHQIHPIEKIFWGRCQLNTATSLLVFGKHGIGQKLLHQLKYHADLETGNYLGGLLGEKIQKHPGLTALDGIIPVPLFKRKKHQRGYNQSEVIGSGIAEKTALPIITNYLLKTRETSSQTRKNRLERVENISGSFSLDPAFEPGKLKHILLIDDVITTGSTLEACINLLSPYHQVSVATLAYQ